LVSFLSGLADLSDVTYFPIRSSGFVDIGNVPSTPTSWDEWKKTAQRQHVNEYPTYIGVDIGLKADFTKVVFGHDEPEGDKEALSVERAE
jgi:hypothetical protein